MKPVTFDHEKLNVYQKAITFIAWVDDVLEDIQRKAAVKDQLDRASTSIALNVAEGNGKMSSKERSHFFLIARGSAVECAACLDILVAKRLVDAERVAQGKAQLFAIVNMLMGLLNHLASCVKEDEAIYRLDAETTIFEHEHEHEHEFTGIRE